MSHRSYPRLIWRVYVCFVRQSTDRLSVSLLTADEMSAICKPNLTKRRNPHMFDAHRFLTQELGPPQSVPSLFLSYGVEPPKDEAVQKWYRRRSIPGDWFATILCILELDRGEPVRLSSYVTRV